MVRVDDEVVAVEPSVPVGTVEALLLLDERVFGQEFLVFEAVRVYLM